MLKKIIINICNTLINKLDQNIILNNHWTDINFILKSNNFNENYLNQNLHIQEIEHQIGRFLNMKKIIEDIENEVNNFNSGDIIEFGTWQGLGLIYFARLLESNPNNRKLIGIDSFEGLPHSSTIWKKGDFSNTELQLVKSNIINHAPKEFDANNIILIKGWFNDEKVKNALYNNTSNVSLIHFDADLYSSTKQALQLIEPLILNSKNPIYLLFDDWGCHQAEVPDAFYEWIEKIKLKTNFTIEKISNTKYTRYYKLTKLIF
jgi:hypothetical protein